MKKIFPLFVLMLVVVSVQAKKDKLNATLAAENGTYSENVFTWTSAPYDGGGQRLKLFNGMKGKIDLTKYKYLHIKISDKSEGAGWRFVIMCNNNANTYAYASDTYGITTELTVDLTSLALRDTEDRTLAEVNGIYVQGQWTAGNFTILESDCYLETYDYETMKITTSLTSSSTKESPFQFKEQGSDYDYTGEKFLNNIGNDISNGVIFGHSDGNSYSVYWDVTGYNKVNATLTTAAANQIRFMYSDTKENPTINKTQTITTNSGTTAYSLDLDMGNRIGNIKTQNGGSHTIKVASIDFIKEFDEISSTLFDIAASTSSSVNYDREYTAGRKSTVCLPFALTTSEVSAAGTFYELTDYDGTTLTFTG